MPSPVRTHDTKKHNFSGSSKFEGWGSSGFRTKKLKREDGTKEWTGKPSELCGRVKRDLEPVHLKKKTMDARKYKSMFKHQPTKDKSLGSNGISTGSGSQFLPQATTKVSEGGTRSHSMQKSLQGRLKADMIELCQVLQLPEDVRVTVGKFLEYVCKHEVSRGCATKLEAFQISLCWNAASLLKYQIDKEESLLLAKQYLHFGCSVEEVSDVDSTLRKLRNTFVIDVFNVKELDSSKQCISAFEETKKDQEQPPKSRIEEREFQKCTKRVERKIEKRMERLAKKEPKEIDEFNRIWGKRKVQLVEQHRQRASLVNSRHSNDPVKLKEFKRLDDELRKKMEEHKYQIEISLKNLKAHHLAEKSKEIRKKVRWFKEMKSSQQVEQSYMMPCDETGSVSGWHGSVNASENNTVTKLPPSEEQLPNRPRSNVEEVIEGAGKELVGDLHRSSIDSENNIATKSPSSEEQIHNEPPSSLGEVIKSAAFELGVGFDGSSYTSQTSSQNNFASNMPSSELQLPLGASPSVKEAMKSADNELSLQLKRPQLSTCTQMANTETRAQKDNGHIPVEAGTSDQIVHEWVSTNPSEQQQQPSSAEVTVDTNQRSLPSPSSGGDHGLVLANPSEHRQLPPSANIHVDTNQPTSASAAASVVDQTPPSEDPFVSIDMEAPQESHCPPLPVDTNLCHPVLASVVELAPHRERPIVTLNAEVSRQLDNSQPLQSMLGPVFNPTTSSLTQVRDESPRPNQPEPRVASNNNHHLLDDTPLLPDQVNSRAHLETASSINSYTGDSRSYPLLQGARQATPQMLAQRLTCNPLYNEYERLCRESERAVEVHENMKLQLNSDCESELAEIRKKYDLKLLAAEAAFVVKKKELDTNTMKAFMNGLYAESLQNMAAEYIPTYKMPQEVSSNLMQQVHLPHSQAQPIFSPSTFTSSASVLSACNRQNGPNLIGMVTNQPNFRDSSIQAPPLLQHCGPQPPFTANSIASVLQRVPPHPDLPRRPTFESVHFGMGPRAAVRGCHRSLENQYSSRSTFLPRFQNQMATHPSSILLSHPASGSNLRLLSQVVANNGGSGRNNMRNSGGMTGFICLSDDD